MPRTRISKSTAKRYTKVPTPSKEKASKTDLPAAAQTVIAAECKPAVATKVAEVTPVAAAASPATVTAVMALRSPDADTARDAATALGTLGEKAAVEPLVEVLNNTEGYYHSVVRAAAASSLGQISDRRAVLPLVATLADPAAEVSCESIRALALLGDESVIDALIDVVRNQNNYFLPVTRQAAICALVKFGGERAAGELRGIASNEFEEPAIRHAAQAVVSKEVATARA